MKIKVAITDDHPIVAQGLQLVLTNETDIEVVGVFPNGSQLLKGLQNQIIDVLLLDIYLNDTSGLDLCKQLSVSYPEMKIVAISGQDESMVISQMLQNGAKGYVLKNAENEEIVEAIRKVDNGTRFLCKRTQEILSKADAPLNEIPKITRREKEVLMLISEGKTTIEIADQLFISPHTVESHRKNLMEKFQTKSTASVVNLVKKLGLI